MLIFVSLSFLWLSTAATKADMKISKYYNDKITTVDNLLPESALIGLSDFVAHYSTWVYQRHDPRRQRNEPTTSQATSNGANIQWLSHLNVSLFEETETWSYLRDAAEQAVIDHAPAQSYRPYSVSSFLVRRLDPHRLSDDECRHSDDLIGVLFLTRGWLKNDYGELLLSDSRGGVAASFMPYRGRVVFWSCDVPFVFRPPGMAYKQGQYGILLKLTRSDVIYQNGLKHYEEIEKLYRAYNFLEFPLPMTNDDVKDEKINLTLHLTRKYTDRFGRGIAVYDNILNENELDELRSYLVDYHDTYHYQIHDESTEEDSDNVQWVSGLPTSLFLRSRLWILTRKIAAHLSNETGWFPYDVALNIIRSVDYTRIHKDCDDNENELTLLIYLNPNYDVNDHGETVFLEEIPQSTPISPGNEVYELFSAVRSRYGRFCIFNGGIPHSARPPSIEFVGARYTFAVKLSKSIRIAKAKSLQEILEGGYSRSHRDISGAMKELYDQLVEGIDEEKQLPPLDFLAEQLHIQSDLLLKERYEKRIRALQYFKKFVD